MTSLFKWLPSVVSLAALAAGQPVARATLLSDLIATGASIQSGNLVFSNFATPALNTVKTTAIDITPAVDAAGNFGLRFASSAIASNGGGDIIADVTFTVTTTGPGLVLSSVHQGMAATLNGPITAFDFTTFTPPGGAAGASLTNCANGDRAGCPQSVNPIDDAPVANPVPSAAVIREVQLQAAKGTVSSGSVTSWTSTFSTTLAPALQLAVSHAGSWTQGQNGATYTILVSDAAGAGAVNGTVTVTENLPLDLALAGFSGVGWLCSGNVCTRSDVLSPGASYPPITVSVNVSPTAPSPLLNSVDVTAPGAAAVTATDSAIVNPRPSLSAALTHVGNFIQGQAAATYTITVSNAAGAGPTNGTVTVTETVPVGLTLVSMTGTGWTCAATNCSRSDVLAAGASYPPLTATVNVSATASSPLVNSVSVSGGAAPTVTATDSTLVTLKPLLSIAKSHTGNFTKGQTGSYSITVSNAATAGATAGTVTVTDTLPAGLTLASMTGTGWTCATNTCTRADSLAAGASYPTITVTVNVASTAAASVVNSASVSGGGSVAASAADTTIVNAAAALSIAKTHTGSFTQGQNGAAYTIVVSNAATAGPTSGAVTVSDTLPTGLTLVSMTGTGWTCTANSCARSDVLAAGASYPAITVTVNVGATATSPLVNSATVSGGGSASATVTDSTVIVTKPVLGLAVTHTGNFTQGQTGAAYTLAVSNAATAGPTSGTVTVTETLPTGLTLVSMTGTGWTCAANSCTRSDVLAAGASYPAITVTVNVGATATSPLVNSATVSGGGSASATATDSTVIVAKPVLSLTATHTGNFTQGQTGATYTLAVSNAATAGPTAGVVTVTETLPTGLTLISMTGTGWTCTANSCTRSDVLAASASYPAITVTVNVGATATSPLVNSATVSGGGSASATATDSTIVVPTAVLSLAATHAANFTQGQTGAAYTLAVSNAATAGPTSGTVTVTDTLPAGLTLVSLTGTGWTCAANSCTRSDVLAAGAAYPAITVTVNVAATATSPLVNSATVSGGGSTAATATDSTIVVPTAVLSLAATHAANFTQGQTGATYTLAVSNAATAGPTSGTVTVSDTLPAGLTLVSMTGTGWTCAANTCTRSDVLAAAASYPAITVTVNVAATATSPLVNSATVSGGGSTAATATDSTVIVAKPVLGLAVTHTGNFTQGQTGATYTLAVSNAATAGPTTGTVTVSDTLPAGLTLVSMTGTGWTCAANSCTRSDVLAAGAAYPALTVTVNVAANATSPLLNSATVSGGGSASATATDSTVVVSTPVLSVAASHAGNFTQGQTGATYTLAVSNSATAGPTAGAVTVTDTLPGGLTLVSMTGTGWTCAANTCTRSDVLAAGAAYPALTVTVNVAANATSPLVNAVSVSGGGAPTASATDTTLILGSAPSLAIASSHSGAFAQGQKNAAYTLVVTNIAAGAATSGTVSVIDSLPSGLSLVSMSGAGWSCSAATCTRADALAAGASYPPITVAVNVSTTAVSPQVNSATVSGGGSASATATDATVITLGTAALSISKTHSGSFTQGQNGATYSIVVANNAGSAPTNSTVTVTDTVPAGLTLVSMTGTGWNCGGNSCKRSDVLAAGTSYPPIVVTVNVASTASATVVNTAAVSGGGAQTVTTTDSTTVVSGGPALSVVKTHAGAFRQGQTAATYSVTVSNAAGAAASSGTVTVTDTLPAGLSLVSMAGTGWTCSLNTCNRADALAAGASYPAITVTVNVAANAAASVVNTVSLTGGGSAPASASDPTVISAGSAALTISKTHAGSFTQGQNGASYTVVVTNGAAAAPTSGTVTVTETLPAGLTLAGMSGTGWTCVTASCSRADALAPGSAYPAIAVLVNVAPNAVSPQVNTVTVTGGGSASSSASDSTVVAALPASLSIAKSHVGNLTQGQAGAVYTVLVANAAGAGATSGTVTVTDTVPTGLTLVSMSGTGWACVGASCSRADSLAAGATYPAIAVTVNVAATAASPIVNTATVSGGGSASATTADSAIVIARTAILSITKSHAGSFTQGQNGAAYSILVSNAPLASPTAGTVTVADTLPAGLALASMSGTGWTCVGASCTRADALASGSSYPPITVTVNVAGTAASPLVNTATVSGGGAATASAGDSTVIIPNPAVLSLAKSHVGSFVQGQSGVAYTLTVANAAGAGATAGTVTVTEVPPAGLGFIAMSGTGWTCAANLCSRADVLPAGAIYPPITATFNVGATAPSPLVNAATVSGGGSAAATASDAATVLTAPTLGVAVSHTANFIQGQANAIYTIGVSNAPGAAATSGPVQVTDSLPSGLSLISMTGAGWTCAAVTCTRSDALAGGGSYPAITVTVNVSAAAVSPQINVVSATGGGSAGASASDSTVVLSKAPVLSIVSTHAGNFVLGQNGATYTLVVNNSALSPSTSSTVTVGDTVPSGMTFVSMSGAGWTCNGNSCKRADALPGGASYPPITVTVNVAPNAGSLLVNSAQVSGGGGSSAATTDLTIVTP